jgi:regulator of nonsense transcripts 2
MVAESLESRKFERKTMFDVPLPMRRAAREASTIDESPENTQVPPNTMAFSLMTKRGNRQQVCYECLSFAFLRNKGADPLQTRTIDLPSDSSFAVAMKTQQQAEREEQQRIKNLVLNYDLRDDSEQNDGEHDVFSTRLSLLAKNPNAKGVKGLEKRGSTYRDPKADKSGSNRSGFRARKLQLSDVDWYERKFKSKP